MVSAALIGVVLRKVSWPVLAHLVERLDWGWAVAGSLLTPLLIGGLAVRWRIFVRQQKLTVSFGSLFALTWAGQFFNSVLPGSTGGDVIKVYQMCRISPQQKAAAAATVFVDRLTALTALLVMCGIALFVDPAPVRSAVPTHVTPTALLLSGGIAIVAGISGALFLWRLLRATRVGGRIERTLRAATQALSLSQTSAVALSLAFLVHALNFWIFYCFTQALHVSITYRQVLMMMPVLMLVVLLPVTINGHGLRELLFISYFRHFNVTVASSVTPAADIAVAASLLLVANDLLWSLPGGFWYMALRNQLRPLQTVAAAAE